MRPFTCDRCDQLVFFDNTACTRCGADLALDLEVGVYRAVDLDAAATCANREHGCPWLVADGQPFCASCRLTRTRPALEDAEVADAWRAAEAAKRRLVFQLHGMGIPLDGVAFDLLSSREQPVTTGHADGLITLDLAEADDVERVRLREQLAEPYRTVLGHMRHEIGHFLWDQHVRDSDRLEGFRALFGDERADYAAALQAHYEGEPPQGWAERYVSTYATAHPWEDVAETIAHLLHITDVLETARSFGITVDGAHRVLDADPEQVDPDRDGIQTILDEWLPLTYALNAVNRSMGHDDLYPFVLAPEVVEKLGWVLHLFRDVAGEVEAGDTPPVPAAG